MSIPGFTAEVSVYAVKGHCGMHAMFSGEAPYCTPQTTHLFEGSRWRAIRYRIKSQPCGVHSYAATRP
jgi:hypothetical protein